MAISASDTTDTASRWQTLQRTTTEVKGFITSLNPENFSASPLSEFDQKTFSLKPCSSGWNEKGPDPFMGTQEAFRQLRDKVSTLKTTSDSIIETLSTPSPEVLEWHSSLIEIVQKVDLRARSCMVMLVNHYIQNKKEQKANSLLQYSKVIFGEINDIHHNLSNHFKKDLNYTKTIEARLFGYQAHPILEHRHNNRQHLKEVSWSAEHGVVIDEDLVQDCLADLKAKAHPDATKEAIRNAANFLGVPNEADKIAIPFERPGTFWNPLHPITDEHGQVKFASTGVTGTCERDNNQLNKENENICNVYYYVNPHDSQLVISSGVIDTKNKAKQLASCIQKASETGACHNSKRYIIHQLNSFLTEEKLIQNTHTAAVEVEKILQESEPTQGKNKISVLHLNTAFNAATTMPGEETKSLKINQEALLQLAHFTVEDVEELLPSQIISALGQLKQKLKECQHFIDKSKQPADDLPPFACVSTSAATATQTVESFSKDNSFQTTSPTISRDLYTDYPAILKDIQASIEELEVEKTKGGSNLQLDKSILLLTLLRLNLGLQFKSPDVPSFSRCTKIELLILTYKLLKIHLILICKSGLDRSCGGRTFEIGLSRLEQLLYQEELTQVHLPDNPASDFFLLPKNDLPDESVISHETTPEPSSASPSQETQPSLLPTLLSQKDQEKVQVRTYQSLFDFIYHYEANRQIIVNMFSQIMKENQVKLNQARGWFGTKIKPYAEDLAHLNKIDTQQVEHPRTQLLNRIKEIKHLRHTLFYEEIVILSVFKEAIKTLFSTGIVGLKYHQDAANWLLRKWGSNNYPMQRWPLFISLKKNEHTFIPIQLIQITTNWVLNSFWQSTAKTGMMTKIAQQLILRFGQKRGD